MVQAVYDAKTSQKKASVLKQGKLGNQVEWMKYFISGRSNDARNELIAKYMPVVERVAEKIHKRLPSSVLIDDLYQDGVFGLIKAIEEFNPQKGFQPQTYFSSIIRGNILDELRGGDWVPRLVRYRHARVGEAKAALHSKLGREPTPKEMAKKMGLSMEKYQVVKKDAHSPRLGSLETGFTDNDDDGFIKHIIADERVVHTEDSVIRKDLLRYSMQSLGGKEKEVFSYRCCTDLTMDEIGVTMNIRKSRVSQLHSAAVKKIREKIKKEKEKSELTHIQVA